MGLGWLHPHASLRLLQNLFFKEQSLRSAGTVSGDPYVAESAGKGEQDEVGTQRWRTGSSTLHAGGVCVPPPATARTT